MLADEDKGKIREEIYQDFLKDHVEFKVIK